MKRLLAAIAIFLLSVSAVQAQSYYPGNLPANPRIPGTQGITLPGGFTSQRASNPLNGALRYSRTLTKLEAFVGGSWETVASGPLVGTVQSVGLSLPGIFTVSGSPVTTSGTLTGSLASQSQNLAFMSPDGMAGIPAFRALVNADLPVVDLSHGGTGLSTITANYLLGGNATGTGIEGKQVVSPLNTVVPDFSTPGQLKLEALTTTAAVSSLPVTLTAASAVVQNTSVTGDFTLPLASDAPGKMFIINRRVSSALSVRVLRAGSDTIGKISQDYRLQGERDSVILQSDGVNNWAILASNPTYISQALITGATQDFATFSVGECGIYNSNYSGGPSTVVTLPANSSSNRGKKLIFTKGNFAPGTGDVVLTPVPTNTIAAEGSFLTTLTLTEPHETVTLVAVGLTGFSGWQVLSHYKPSRQVLTSTQNTVAITTSTTGRNLETHTSSLKTAGTYNLTASDATYQVATGTGTYVFNLPLASSAPGKPFFIAKAINSTITINRAGSDLIDTGAAVILNHPDRTIIGLLSDGASKWLPIQYAFGPEAGDFGAGEQNARLQTNSWRFAFPIQTGTSYNPTSNQNRKVAVFDATSNNIAINLPDITASAENVPLWFIRDDAGSNTVTINAFAGDTIYKTGTTSLTLPTQGSFVGLAPANISSLQRWRVVAGSPDVLAQMNVHPPITSTDSSLAISKSASGTDLTVKMAVTAHTGAGTAAIGLNTVDGSGGSYDLDLPTAVGIAGKKIVIKRIDNTPANTVTVDANTETIDGANTYPLTTQWQSVSIISDGANWLIESPCPILAIASFRRRRRKHLKNAA